MNPPEMYYSRDPIVEAILGVQLAPLPPEDLPKLERLQDVIGPAYTKTEPLHTFMGEFRFDGGAPGASTTSTQVGYLFKTADQRQTLTARLDGFAYSHLAPYPGWRNFRSEAVRLWRIYRSVMGEQSVSKGELRYLNRFEIPVGEEFSKYLQTFPEIGKELPQRVAAYSLQANLLLDRMPGLLVLRQSQIPSEQPGHGSIILDNTILFDLDGETADDGLWKRFEEAHTEKNIIFKGCITPAMEDRIR